MKIFPIEDIRNNRYLVIYLAKLQQNIFICKKIFRKTVQASRQDDNCIDV